MIDVITQASALMVETHDALGIDKQSTRLLFRVALDVTGHMTSDEGAHLLEHTARSKSPPMTVT